MKRIRIISIMLTFVLLCVILSSCETPERIAYPQILDYETYGEEDIVANERSEFYAVKKQECAYYQLSSLITSDAKNKTCTLSVYRTKDDDNYPYENIRIPNYYTSPEDEDKPTEFNGYSIRFWLLNSDGVSYAAGFVNAEEEFDYIKSVLDTLKPYKGKSPEHDFSFSGWYYIELTEEEKTQTYEFNITGQVEKDGKFYKLKNIADYYAIAAIAEKYSYITPQLLDIVGLPINQTNAYELCVRAPYAHTHYDKTKSADFLSNLPLKEEAKGSVNIAKDGILATRYINNTQFLTDDAIILTQVKESLGSSYYLTKEGRLVYIALLNPTHTLKSHGYVKIYGYSLVMQIFVSQPIFDYDALLALISD